MPVYPTKYYLTYSIQQIRTKKKSISIIVVVEGVCLLGPRSCSSPPPPFPRRCLVGDTSCHVAEHHLQQRITLHPSLPRCRAKGSRHCAGNIMRRHSPWDHATEDYRRDSRRLVTLGFAGHDGDSSTQRHRHGSGHGGRWRRRNEAYQPAAA